MENLITIKELAQTLKVSKVWLYKLVREKRIPCIRLGECVRFCPSEIEKWLESRRNSAENN